MTVGPEVEAKELLRQHRGVLGSYGRRLRESQEFDAASQAIDLLNEQIDLDANRFGVHLNDGLVYRREDGEDGYRQYGTLRASAGWKFIGDKLLPMRINPDVKLPHNLSHLGETAMTLALINSENGVGVSIDQSLTMPTVEETFRYGWYDQTSHLIDRVRQMDIGDHIHFDNSPI